MAKKATAVLEVKDLLGKSLRDLVKMRTELKKEIYENTIKNSLRSLNQTHLIGLAKRNIARVQTAMTQKLDSHTATATLNKATATKTATAKVTETTETKPAKKTAKKTTK